MRTLTIILVVTLGALRVSVADAETYRWEERVGDKVIVHYSDRPPPKSVKAEKVELPSAQTYTSTPSPTIAGTTSNAVAAAPDETVNCRITSPQPEEVLPNVTSVSVSFAGPRGAEAVLYLNGAAQRSPAGLPIYTISPIARGTYQAVVVFEGSPGEVVCRTPELTFYVRQPSVLQPSRSPAPSNTNKRPPAR